MQDEHKIEVNFDLDPPEELEESALRVKELTSALSGGQLPQEQPALSGGQLPLERPALCVEPTTGGQLPLEQPALSVEPTIALVKVPSSRHEKSAEGSTDSELSITYLGSDHERRPGR